MAGKPFASQIAILFEEANIGDFIPPLVVHPRAMPENPVPMQANWLYMIFLPCQFGR
jgi:hypothetical protein